MAKLQVLIAMTLNGFVPARNDSLLQWIQNSDDGFPYWRGRSTRMLYPGYPLVDLICDKEQSGQKHSETESAALLIAKHCNKRLHALAFAIPQSAPIFRG